MNLLSNLRAVGLAAALVSPSAAQSPDPAAGQRREQQQASEVIGLPVKSPQNEKIGTVEDLMVDLRSGRVLGIVIATEGAHGGDRRVVSPDSLGRASSASELRIDREKLTAAPRLRDDSRQAPSAGEDAPSDADVPASQDGAAAADNTARNRRDRAEAQTLAPLDQSNKRSDVQTTARIRSAIMKRSGLSTNAKNVKIITREGQVTLRGPVANENERRIIAGIAEEVAAGRPVNNQLEVARP